MNDLRELYLQWKRETGGTMKILSEKAGVSYPTVVRAVGKNAGSNTRVDNYLAIKEVLEMKSFDNAETMEGISREQFLGLMAKKLRTLADQLEDRSMPFQKRIDELILSTRAMDLAFREIGVAKLLVDGNNKILGND